MFQFKRFKIHDDRSSMKVGTDGVLLGAWAGGKDSPIPSCDFSILDIGCGSGLISLMMAQRFPGAHILGVDIDESSVIQARENVADSPFANNVEVALMDIRQVRDRKFHIIVCNPPFYTVDTVSPDSVRANARNTRSLPFEDLVDSVSHLLSPEGIFAVVLPASERNIFVNLCHLSGLHLSRETLIRTVQRKPHKRTLLQFDFSSHETQQDELILQQSDGKRTPEYQSLCSHFYLDN